MAKSFQKNPIDVVDMPKFNDRQIYNNAIADSLDTQANAPGYAVPRQNVYRINSKKRTKTSNIVGTLFLIATAALLYVGNVIAVNNLAKEVNDLNAKHVSVSIINVSTLGNQRNSGFILFLSDILIFSRFNQLNLNQSCSGSNKC